MAAGGINLTDGVAQAFQACMSNQGPIRVNVRNREDHVCLEIGDMRCGPVGDVKRCRVYRTLVCTADEEERLFFSDC